MSGKIKEKDRKWVEKLGNRWKISRKIKKKEITVDKEDKRRKTKWKWKREEIKRRRKEEEREEGEKKVYNL